MKTVQEAIEDVGIYPWDCSTRWAQRWAKKHGVAKHGQSYAFTDADVRAMRKELGFK